MKTTTGLIPRLILVFVFPLGLMVGPRLFAQDIPAISADGAAATPLTPQQLDELLGPIALYPDALIAVILPAATTPGDIVLASRYMTAAGTQAEIDTQNWSDAVQALAHYPEVLKWMDTNLQWTTQVGNAFVTQQEDVMGSIQRLRAIARANGSLDTTAQQQVVVDGDAIEILPVQPDLIYVPRYDPDVVYDAGVSDDYYDSSVIGFGPGYPVGLWLDYDFDWHGHRIWVGDHRHSWRDHRDWRQHPSPGGSNNSGWHAWRPPANRPRPPHTGHRPPSNVVRPRPLPGAPPRPSGPARPRPDRPARPLHNTPGPRATPDQGPGVNTRVAPPQPRVAPPQPRVAPPMQRVAAPAPRVAPVQSRVAVPESRVAVPQSRVVAPMPSTPPPVLNGNRPVPGTLRVPPPAGRVVAPPVKNVPAPAPHEHVEERHDKEN